MTAQPITLTAKQLDTVRRAMLEEVHQGLQRTTDLVDQLRQSHDLDDGPTAADVRSSIRMLHVELDALDALGWHDAHTRADRGDVA